MPRPSLDHVMLGIALCLAHRATCQKLAVGCVLTDVHGRIIGSGYNGVPRGMPHCTDCACAGAVDPAGSDTCIAVHAEANALLNCRDPELIDTCYCTYAPCLRCTKTLLNTSCKRIVYYEDKLEPAARSLWLTAGRTWFQISEYTGALRPTD